MADKSSSVEPRSTIRDIAPYVPGRDKAPDGVKLFKLSSNETPLGPSPKAVEAFRGMADALSVYPDGSATILRRAIAEAHGLNADRILCGNGSDELLGLLCQAYIRPGDEAIFTEHGFLVYRIQILAAGGTPIAVPESDLHADVDAILGAVTDRTRLVLLANPNNPTGTYMRQEEVRRLRENLPSNVLLILDAAYAEYVRRNDYEAGIEMVADHDNVVMTRTFSKIYGLAALRIGWLFGPPSVIDTLNRIRGPFNVNSAAIAAGVAAMEDRQHRAKAVSHNDEWLPWLTRSLTELGLTVTPSVGNFLLVHFPGTAGKSAAEADAFLVQRGYILRQMTAYGLPDALRLTVGTSEANEGVVEALRAFLHG